MKNYAVALLLLAALALACCSKKNETTINGPSSYTSIAALKQEQALVSKTYTVSADDRSLIITPNGGKLYTGSGVFRRMDGYPATGEVQIELLDLYKNTDLMLAGLSTIDVYGNPLKSGGEFFIRATQSGQALGIIPGTWTTMMMPDARNGVPDSVKSFIWELDTTSNITAWYYDQETTVNYEQDSLLVNLYQMHIPVGQGTWCSAGNPYYFGNYLHSRNTFNMAGADTLKEVNLYKVQPGKSCVIQLPGDRAQFIDTAASVGLPVTMVAVGISNGNVLMASFTPVTQQVNHTFSLQMAPINVKDFIKRMRALD